MPKTYDKQTGTFLAKVAECMPNLPASVMQGLMENPSFLKQLLLPLHPWAGQVFQRFLCHQPSDEHNWLNEVRSKVYLGIWGQKLFDAAFATVPQYCSGEVVTVRLKLRQIGFTEPVALCDFKKRGQQFGLIECPLFVAYHYRLRYTNQPLNEQLYILTKSVDVGNDELSLFGLTHKEMYVLPHVRELTKRLWLDGHNGQADFKWDPNSEWVFALKQSN